jgi:flagellar hook-associated protein 1
MRSTFHGLETARRGMFTQQSALYTTGHNIANANTPGYSRQRVNFEQTEPYPAAALNRPQIPGQMGTGVTAGSVQRVRDGFLDLQYRGENNKLGYWEARADALKKMEDIMNEPSDSGLAKTMDQFWQSLQDLSVNPENEGARSVVRQRGLAVVETFHYLHDSLSGIKEDLANEIGVTVTEINSLAEQISKINQQIKEVEPNGYLPNDLYDERDRLVDQLSKLINIKVEKVSNVPKDEKEFKLAEGTYNIYLVDSEGNQIKDDNGNLIYLVQGNSYQTLSFPSGKDLDEDTINEKPGTVVDEVVLGGKSIKIYDLTTNEVIFPFGKLRGLIEAYGYENGTDVKGIYPEMLDNLDKLAYSFAKRFNEVHKQGFTLNSSKPSDVLFFEDLKDIEGAAKAIKLSSDVDDDDELNNIAASTNKDEPGNGLNAIKLANVKNSNFASLQDPNPDPSIKYPITAGTLQSYYEGMIGKLAVDAQQANRLMNNSEVLRQSVEERRQSVSGVSLDEEMTNLIKFQHAYNAAARNITVIDEMLDKIINGMGVVGR